LRIRCEVGFEQDDNENNHKREKPLVIVLVKTDH
jgi:hypothetical protein